MNPSKGVEDGVTVEEVVGLLEIGLDEEEEGATVGGGEETVTDGEEGGEGGTPREKSMLGRVDDGREEGNKEGGEILTDDAVWGRGNSDWPELVRGRGGKDFGDEGDVGGGERGGET